VLAYELESDALKAAIATSSMVTELVKGKTIEEARNEMEFEALKKSASEIDTVFSVGLIDRVSKEGTMENNEKIKHLGYRPSINAKVNIGVGRPLAKT
jgi:NifU-like protein involved in Fe-S cluster formation